MLFSQELTIFVRFDSSERKPTRETRGRALSERESLYSDTVESDQGVDIGK